MKTFRALFGPAVATVVLSLAGGCASAPPPETTSPPPPPPEASPPEDPFAEAVRGLDNPDRVAASVGTIVAEYRAQKEANADLKQWVEPLLLPLVEAYTAHHASLVATDRQRLIQLLAGTKDPRTEPALRAAFEAFTQLEGADEDLVWAARAQRHLKLPSLQAPLFKAYLSLEVHTEGGRRAYRDLSSAMLAAPDSAWAPALREVITAPMPPNVEEFRDQLFWQTVAVQLLGMLHDREAVRPLLQVVLDPFKSDFAGAAVTSLIRLGPDTVDPATKVLLGSDRELIEFHAAQRKRLDPSDANRVSSHVNLAAIVLGATGQPAAAESFLEALRNESSPVNRAILLREMAKVPPTNATTAAFKTSFQRLGLQVRMYPVGTLALAELAAEAVPRFYDPTLVPWLLQRAEYTYGDPVARSDFRRAALAAAIQLAQRDQLAAIERKIQPWGTPVNAETASDAKGPRLERALFDAARALLERCRDDQPCYLETLGAPQPAAPKDAAPEVNDDLFTRIKAAYQLGITGDETTATALAHVLSPTISPEVEFAIVQAIDHLLPKGSASVVQRLRTLARKNPKRTALDEVVDRLAARSPRE